MAQDYNFNKKQPIKINWTDETWKKIVNEKFLPLIKDDSRYLILYGGRGSSKSDFVSKLIIYKMLNDSKFRGLLIRNTFSTIKDSSYESVKKAVYEMGLDELFKFTIAPLEISCHNGAKLLCRGLDEVAKIKSVNANFMWVEEDIPKTEGEWISISSGLRSVESKVQEIWTINPETEGHYQDNWFWKKWFANNPTEKSFQNTTTIKRGNREVKLSYTVHHSTYKDNKWLTSDYRAGLEALKEKNPYYFTIYADGLWGIRNSSGLYYKLFNRGKNVYSNIKYNPDLPIYVSFDFNVIPYMSATVWQISGLTASCIEELRTMTPQNNTAGMAREIIRKYSSHQSGFFVMGDATGRARTTQTEEGVDNYSILMSALRQFNPQLRVPIRNPSVVNRGNFINTIFDEQKDGIEIKISDKCVYLINDFMFGKEAPDGSKLKEKETRDGQTYEKYFHLSDSCDYLICEVFNKYFNKYKSGNRKMDYKLGIQPYNEKFKY